MNREENKSVVSIIGIGDRAGRIVNRLQSLNLLDTSFYALGTHEQERGEQSLPHTFRRNYISCFIVSLDGNTDEEFIKHLLQKSTDRNTRAKLLVVTLPHSSEGAEKRSNALHLLTSLEQLVDGIFVADQDTLSGNTPSEVVEAGNSRVFEFVHRLIEPVVKGGMLNFGLNDVITFFNSNSGASLRTDSDAGLRTNSVTKLRTNTGTSFRTGSGTKYIDYISLSGDLDQLRRESKDLYQHFPSSGCSLNDGCLVNDSCAVNEISNLILLVTYNGRSDEHVYSHFLEEIVLGIMHGLGDECSVKWGVFDDPSMEDNFFRVDLFGKGLG